MARKYMKGEFAPTNKEKYIGKVPIVYRSSYEYEFLKWADRSPAVLEYALESVVVKYFNPIKNRNARYIVDVFIKYKNKHGEIVSELIEVKPLSQTMPPKTTKRKSRKTMINEQTTWVQNNAKWHAAKKYAELRGWKFRIVTENSIFKG